jgi:hypothetical protein
MDIPSKCHQEKKISTEEVMFNGTKYYYDTSNKKDIYYYDKQIDGYTLLEDSNIINKIINKI